jgi:hypothetical protein
VPGGQRHGVVEEEDRRPAVGRGERGPPAAELGDARDPQHRGVVPDDLFVVVDEAAPVAREHPPPADRVQVAERVDSVATRHGGRFCRWVVRIRDND